jgi:prevent-host-death family protein
MISLKDEIDSLSNFKRNTSEFVEQLKKSGRPVVLTINGRAELVVQDAESYQRLLEISERLETIEALRPAIEEMKAGKGEPAELFLSKI